MSTTTDEEAVEQVAEAIYTTALERPPRNPWAQPWGGADRELKDLYRDYARAAIQAHYAAYQTPYEDEGHQGGNLLELFLKIHAENFKLRAQAQRAQELSTGLPETLEEAQAEIVALRTIQADYSRTRADLEEAHSELGRRQRQGQTAMNVLALLRPDMANEIQGTDLDPFDKDENLAGFFAWLIERTRDNLLLGKLEKRVAEDDGVRHKLDDVLAEMHDDEAEEALRELLGDNPPGRPYNTPGPGTIEYGGA